jgi:hypothetical protein
MNASKILLCALCAALVAGSAGCRKKKPEQPGAGSGSAEPARPAGPPLRISDISFAGPAGHRPDANYARGETVLCLFTVTNFTYHERKAHIQATVEARGPGGELVVFDDNIDLLKGKAPTLVPGTLRSMAKLPISPAASPGRYTVKLSLRDLLGNRAGSGEASFTLLGTPPQKAARLTLDQLQLVADQRVPPGAIVPIAVELRGFAVKKGDKQGEHRVRLAVSAALVRDSTGEQVHKLKEESLVEDRLLFSPLAYPAEYQLPLPADLSPGSYTIAVNIRDRNSQQKVSGKVSLSVVPPAPAVVNLHVHDASGLSRPSFLLGEQTFVRLSVWGLKVVDGEVSVEVDLAVGGPDGGTYLVRTAAASLKGEASRPVAKAGRYPVQLPLILPTLAPTGNYRVVVRARDLLAKRTITRQHKVNLRGLAPKPLAKLGVDELEVRERPDLPPLKGDTFGAGRKYQLYLRVGGVKPKEVDKGIHEVRLEGSLTLRDLKGEKVFESKKLFTYDRRMTYLPLRVVIPAEWTVPSDLPGGLYDLGVTVLNLENDRVSQMTRRIEVVSAGPAVEVKL